MDIEIVQALGGVLVGIFAYMAKALHSIDKNVAVAVNRIGTLEEGYIDLKEKQQASDNRIRDLEINH